ncbi:clavesin-1-like [Vanessa cardui]|uniref:clavesin-1-like n=1 Tax=Vanessa cardui TaxID=171605 RepID=UPI001F13BE8F|nr:clavesin-1-like [Vanessa cardui]
MNIRPLTPELAEKARVELNEDPNRIASDLQHIKDWLSKQPHLRACTDDQWLVAFLRGCKYSLERTKEKLDLYYSLRGLAPEIYNVQHDDAKFDTYMNNGAYLMLLDTETPTSPRTGIIRPGKYDPDTHNVADFYSVTSIIQKILLFDDDKSVISGNQWIIDLKDVKIGHLLQMTPSIMKKMVYSSQEAAPIRMKGTHFVNAPAAFERVLNTMKNFLNEKNRNRIYVYQNYEELYKNIPKSILPKEYGGDSASVEEIIEYWNNKKIEYDSWLKEEMKNGTDESKRPGKPKTAESLFGVEGSFRQNKGRNMQIRPLCAELAKKAQDELNEDPARIASDVQHIKDWLSKQPHLRARKDDQWLVAFLRGCKYSLERTKEKLDLYYSMRSLAPELFSVLPGHKIFTEIMNNGTYLILPKSTTPDSPRVAIVRPGSYDPDKYKLSDIFSVSIVLQRILLMEDDATVISGFRTILDLEGVTMAHYLQMTPAMMKKMAVLSQDAAPMRMKGTHYINTPPGFETVFSAIKNLLNEKNRKRLYVHNKNYEEMYSHGISKDILPAEYGGNGGTIKEIIDHWKDKVQKYSSWLEEDLKYGTDESKRPGQPKTPESMFGLEGSFRQLNFD